MKEVLDRPGFAKDETSGSILNINNQALSSYKKQKKLFSQIVKQQSQIEKLEKTVAELLERVDKLENKWQ